MNKFIAAFDGLRYSQSTKDYALSLAKAENAHLTGVFLDDKTYTSYKIYDLVLEQGVSEKVLNRYKHEDEKLRSSAADSFEHDCQHTGITFNIHHDRKIAINELLHETIFSDLLIINRNENFVHHEEKYPSRFMRDLLSDTQCPVLLTPDKYTDTEKIIFLFDGQHTSLYALKMFNYIFPHFKELPIEVVTVKPMESDLHMPESKLIKEFLKRHYKNIIFTVLKGVPEVEIVNHLYREKLRFISILGAYRRTMLSRWFKSSMADALVKNYEMPVFIAHNK